jgi:hypothetical protein
MLKDSVGRPVVRQSQFSLAKVYTVQNVSKTTPYISIHENGHQELKVMQRLMRFLIHHGG